MKALALADVATPMRGCGAGSHLLPEVFLGRSVIGKAGSGFFEMSCS
jgi:hypothetical protein